MSSPRTRLSGLLLLLVVLITGVAAATAQAYGASVTVSSTTTTAPQPDGFLGLALEFSTIPAWTNNGASPVNPVLVQLIKNLDPTGRPSIRIGGQSTERSWWPTRGQSKPLGVTYSLTSAWTHAAKELAQAVDAQLLLGVNLEADRPHIAKVEANHFLKGIGRQYISALELGNEPDLYHFVPWYHEYDGHPVPWYLNEGTPVYSRPPGYDPTAFVGDVKRELSAMPQVPVAGPETSPGPWLAAFARLMTPTSRVKMLTTHAYGLNNCVHDASSPDYPSVPNLLSENASRTLTPGLGSYIAQSHRDGGTLRIDEMGSVTCNGHPGVSDTMASALWATDALFSIAQAHVDGINLHTFPHSSNGLFDFTLSHGQWQASVHPIYYGVLMFARAAPMGSRLLHTSSTGPSDLRSWATLGADGATRVLLINDSTSSSATAAVRLPAGVGSGGARLQRLTAPSAYAKGGLHLGGRSFGPTTTTGALPVPALQSVTATNGTYSITLPPASEALLTVEAPGTTAPGTTPTPAVQAAAIAGGPTMGSVRTWILLGLLLAGLAAFSLTTPSLSKGQVRVHPLHRSR